MKTISVLWSVLVLAFLAGCSSDNANPAMPEIQANGYVAISNACHDHMFVTEIRHNRGAHQAIERPGIPVNAGGTVQLHNLLDPEAGHQFRIGDEVRVTYSLPCRESDKLGQPFMQTSVNVRIEGVHSIVVYGNGAFMRYPE